MIYETASSGITVFVTTHYMDEAEYCDRISIMNEGKIVALDTPENLKKQYGAGTVEEVFIKIARLNARVVWLPFILILKNRGLKTNFQSPL